jgi:hypothetical protein
MESVSDLSSRPKRTRISCLAKPKMATYAAFLRESRRNFANVTKFYRKSGGAKWSDLLLPTTPNRSQSKQPPYDLSSRPKRSVAEGPAVLSTPIEPQGKPLSSDLSSRPKWRDLRFSPSQSNLKESHCLQTCHPDRSGGTCGSLHPAEILLDGDVRQSGAPRPANPCPGPDFSTQTIQVTTSFPAL